MSVLCKHMPAAACLSVFSLVLSSLASAETERDLDSHVHGASEMNLVIEGNSVFIEYNSPWANLVGFEHQPSNDEQLSLMSGAMDALAAVDELFVFNSEAECQSASADVQSTVDVALDADAGTEEHAHDDHSDEHADEEHAHGHDDDHSDEHADEEHAHGHDDDHSDEHADEEHAHGHDDDHSDEHADEEHAHGHDDDHSDEHAEVRTSYTFECTNPGQLAELSVRLTESWPGIEDIAVQMAGPGGQTSVELNKTLTLVDLSAVR